MLNVFTLGAGVAVAGLLPDRLALWQVPRVSRAEVESPGSVLSPAGAHGPLPSRKRLAAVLAPLVGAPPLGHHVGAVVTDLATGEVLFSRQAGSPFVPASNAKLLTAVAALSTLGPSARFTTRVVAGAKPGSLILVGGGDPTLAAGNPPRSDYPRPATLAALAGSTARWLSARHVRTVRLAYDASLFTGPSLAPGWTPGYISTGNVTPIAAVRSPALPMIVGWMLRESNNVIAEDLARQVALRTRRPASFSGGAAAVTAVLAGLGVRHGVHLVDGSGLSPLDR